MREERLSPHSSESAPGFLEEGISPVIVKPNVVDSPKYHRRTASSGSADSQTSVRQNIDVTAEGNSKGMFGDQTFHETPSTRMPGLGYMTHYEESSISSASHLFREKEKSSSGPINTSGSTTNRSPKRSQSFKETLLKRFSTAMTQQQQQQQHQVQTGNVSSQHSPVIKSRAQPNDQGKENKGQTQELYSPRQLQDEGSGSGEYHYEIHTVASGQHKVQQRSEDVQLIFNSHPVEKSGVIVPHTVGLDSDSQGSPGKGSPVPSSPRKKDSDNVSDIHSQRSSTSSPSPVNKTNNSNSQKNAESQSTKPPKFSRNRHGSLRNPVVQVLPDKKLLSKASSSENLNVLNSGDLTALTSLVQRKRDSSQESLDQITAQEKSSRSGQKKSDSDDGLDTGAPPNSSRMRPIHIPTRRLKARNQAPKPPVAPVQSKLTTDESSSANQGGVETSDHTDDQESDQSDTEGQQFVIETKTTESRQSSSLEILQQDASHRPAPRIRQPTARISTKRDQSPIKLSSSPPKSVSFNPNNDVYTFIEESSDHRRRSKRSSDRKKTETVVAQTESGNAPEEPQAAARRYPSRVPENGVKPAWKDRSLIDTHRVCLEFMHRVVQKQFDLLQGLESGQKTTEEYRETMNQLLALQTNNIGTMLNYLQDNEEYHKSQGHS